MKFASIRAEIREINKEVEELHKRANLTGKRAKRDFNKYVPKSGPSDTFHGEILRAVNKIGYRYFNDGDLFFEGYGCETAGPAANFLRACVHSKIPHYLQSAIRDFTSNLHETGYEQRFKKLDDAAWKFVEEVENGKLNSEKNNDDMLKYDRWDCEDEDEDEYEDEDSDW